MLLGKPLFRLKHSPLSHFKPANQRLQLFLLAALHSQRKRGLVKRPAALLSHLFRVPVALARKRFDRLRSRLFAAG